MINGKSGSQNSDGLSDPDVLCATLEERTGRKVVRVSPEEDGMVEATRAAATGGYAMVIAAGGDGTIAAVASAIVKAEREGFPRPTLGVLPMGTFNFFARSLGISEDLEQAVDGLVTGTPAPVGLGQINDTVFINNASLGLYPRILREREDIYANWGRSRIAAYWSVLRTLLRPGRTLRTRIRAGGRTSSIRTQLIFVACNAFQLREYHLSGDDHVNAGRLALLHSKHEKSLALIWATLRLAIGRSRPGRSFGLIADSEITIDLRRRTKILVAHDGEKTMMAGPFRLQYLTDAIEVVVPEVPKEGR